MTSTSIYGEFSPRYLYIKQHSVTGLFYFGQTSKDPNVYLGSGTYWKRHIRKYGEEHVVTLWYELFTNEVELTTFAIQFSKDLNIVKSKSWANLVDENGVNGGDTWTGLSDENKRLRSEKWRSANVGKVKSNEHKLKLSLAQRGELGNRFGKPHTELSKKKMSDAQLGKVKSNEHKLKISESLIGHKHSKETKKKMSDAQLGKVKSDETRKRLSAALKGRIQPRTTCPHCGKCGSHSNMQRWHFNNCKMSSA